MLNGIIIPAIRCLKLKPRNVYSLPTRCYKGGPPAATMDDLPKPCGSWEKLYKRDQARYNSALIFGILFTLSGIIAMKASGLFYLHYNGSATTY